VRLERAIVRDLDPWDQAPGLGSDVEPGRQARRAAAFVRAGELEPLAARRDPQVDDLVLAGVVGQLDLARIQRARYRRGRQSNRRPE
jgi:hypothetical protein